MVVFFFSTNVINNAALNFNVPLPLHMIFRSVSLVFFFGQTVNLLVRVDKLCPGSNKDKFPAIFIIKLHVKARQFKSVTWLASSLQILSVIAKIYKLICLSYLHVHCMQLAVTAMFYNYFVCWLAGLIGGQPCFRNDHFKEKVCTCATLCNINYCTF